MTLRLADAILLGDSLKVRNPWLYLPRERDGVICGCAIAGALLAAEVNTDSGSMAVIRAQWPWVTYEIEDEITGQFFEVMAGRHTIEKLCDWVDSIDPTPRCEPPVQEPVEVRQESTVSHG